MSVSVNVQFVTTTGAPPSRVLLSRWAGAALTGVRRRRVSVNLRVVTRHESSALNSRYRHKKGPTNVLSFPFAPPAGIRSDLLGDVVICAEVVRAEARVQNKSERAHWAHMVVHGILHLRGYDHQNSADAAVMESKEVRLLRKLGFPNPYA